jgi:hypothetical protein
VELLHGLAEESALRDDVRPSHLVSEHSGWVWFVYVVRIVRWCICLFRWRLVLPRSQSPNVYVHSDSCYGMLWLYMLHMIPNVEQITNYPRCSASVLVLVIQNHWCWPEPHRPAPQRVQSLAVS